jgi:hypothetical protein
VRWGDLQLQEEAKTAKLVQPFKAFRALEGLYLKQPPKKDPGYEVVSQAGFFELYPSFSIIT